MELEGNVWAGGIGKNITDTEILIGNNLGKINGWILKEDVIGKVVKVED